MPYLNSSIFTKQEIEKTLEINQLENGVTIQIHPATSLYDEKHKKLTGEMPFLQYLFEFLDSFDFGENHSDENKSDLISSAVLGQVFERLNGYKDGSFYTPSFITGYMCKESINKIVLERFAKEFDLNFDDLDIDKLENIIELKLQKSSDMTALFKRLNAIINDIKICDPAVGSGYFLVSALNYIISLKSRLGILVDENGKLLKAKIKYENDELDIMYNDSTRFYYSRPKSADEAEQIIQKTIFNEKAGLIENCLFGVDINPNSCEIARLRLWIELLKSSYFTDLSEPNPLKQNALETLPNIDINIKCGNSLISLFSLNDTFDKTNINLKSKIKEYKEAVKDYKEGSKKSLSKSNLKEKINELKRDFFAELKDPRNKRKLENALKNHINKFGNELLKSEFFKYVSDKSLKQGKFSFDNPTEEAKKSASNIAQLSYELEINLSVSKLYENSMEWRFEFPEILDENGDFMGFDLIIANPPYIDYRKIDNGLKGVLKTKSEIYKFGKMGSIFVYFIELASNIMNKNGLIAFINPINYICQGSYESLRKFIDEKLTLLQMLDVSNFKVFKMASTYTCINIFELKNSKIEFIKFANILDENSLKQSEFLKIKQCKIGNLSVYLNSITSKIAEQKHKKLSDFCEIFCGLSQAGFRTSVLNLPHSDTVPFLESSDIFKYSYKAGKYFEYPQNSYSKPVIDIFEFEQVIFMARMTNFIRATIAESGYYGGKVNVLHNFLISKFYILGLLNSKLLSYFYERKYFASHLQGGALGFDTPSVGELPIPQITPKNQNLADEIINLVDKILKETDENEKANLSSEIDKLVYQIYDLNADEIALIENA